MTTTTTTTKALSETPATRSDIAKEVYIRGGDVSNIDPDDAHWLNRYAHRTLQGSAALRSEETKEIVERAKDYLISGARLRYTLLLLLLLLLREAIREREK